MTYQDITTIIMMLIIFIFFYAAVIMPHKKKEKQLQEMRDGLKIGDEIVTIAGMMGKIINISDDIVTIETNPEKTKINILKWSIQQLIVNK